MKICGIITNATETELDELITMALNPNKKLKQYDYMNVESRIVNVFGKSIENDLYKIVNNESDYVGNETYDDNGNIKTIPMYRIQNEFNALVRVEGAYASFTPPENYVEYFDSPNMDYHGNCESIIGSDLIAPARENQRSVMVGYERVYQNSLLLSGPYDLGSNTANSKLGTVNHQTNCRFLGVKQDKEETRHTHNETVMERLIVNADGNVKKLRPSYIVWMEEELDEKFPPTDEDLTQKWQYAKQAAGQMKIPIVIINREHFAIQETEKMTELENCILGKEVLPKEKTMPEVMRELLCKMENNSNSLRFSDKIRNKYFTAKDRERVNEIIINKIQELAIQNPDLAYECIEAVKERYQFESSQSEAKNIQEYYLEQQFKIQSIQDKLSTFLDKETILLEMNNTSREQFKKDIYEIAKTPFYKNQKQHSIEHIEKVMLFSQILAQNEGLGEEDTNVLLAAAALHDSSRNGDDGNSEHAIEGAKVAGEFLQSNMLLQFGIKKEDIPIIQVAIEYHEFNEKPAGELNLDEITRLCEKYSVPSKDFGRTIKCSELLKDADALDRTRFASRGGLDTKYLRSNISKLPDMIFFAKKVNDEYAKKMIDRNYHIDTEEGRRVSILREQRIKNEGKEEITLSPKEMLDIFDSLTERKNRIITNESKFDILLENYGQVGLTMDDINSADLMLITDLSKAKTESKENDDKANLVNGENR